MMKKFMLSVLSILAVLCLVACGGKEVTVKELTIDGQKTEFFVGDTFSYGDIKVTATYSDASTKDVTNDVKVEQNANMNNAGTYAVIVSYENVSKAYSITVIDNKTIQSIKLDINGVKTSYLVGETIDYSNVNVIEVYKNDANVESINYGELAKYTVKVTDENNNEVNGAFNDKGTYTITVSKDALKASYEVSVYYKTYDTIAAALEAGTENADKVVSGVVTYKQSGFNVTNYNYLFGKDYLEVESDGGKYYYQSLEDGTVSGIFNYDDELSKAYADEDNIKGLNISSFLYYFDNEMYGIEDLLNELQGIVESEDVKSYNYKEEVKKCEVCGYVHEYAYSFETILSDYYYTYVTVEFSLDGANGNFDDVTVTLQGFRLDEMNYDEENDVYTVQEDVTELTMNTVVSAKQVAGERTAENPYDITDYLFSSFDLADAEGNVIGEEAETVVREPLLLNVTNVTPETATVTIDEIDVEITDENGEEVYKAYGYYDSWENVVRITAYAPGTYIVNVKATAFTKTFKLNVNYAELETFVAAEFDSEYYELVEASSVEIPENVQLMFGAIANTGADASFTAALETESENVTLGEEDGYGTFVATATGTYVIILTSTVNPEITAKLEVVVVEAVEMSELLNGEYSYYDSCASITLTYVFTPESEGAVKGTLTISDGETTAEFTYEYNEDYQYLDIVASEGSEGFGYSVEYNPTSQSLWCVVDGWADGELERVEEVVDGELGGKYSTIKNDPIFGKVVYLLKFSSDGTGSFDFSYYSGSFEWQLNEDNTITFSEVVEDYGEAMVKFSGSFDAENNSVELTYTITVEDEYDPYEETDTLVLSR